MKGDELHLAALRLLSLTPDHDPAYAVICLGGLPREEYDALEGGVETLGSCENPDCDCLVWAKEFVDRDTGLIVTFMTGEPVPA